MWVKNASTATVLVLKVVFATNLPQLNVAVMVGIATIRNRGEYQWEAQIRRKGYPAQRKTCETKADAQAWARLIESEMDRGVFVSRAEAERTGAGALRLKNYPTRSLYRHDKRVVAAA